MNVVEALDIVNNLVFWPGWTIRAEPASWMGGSVITVITDIETVDTNREHAPLYRKAKTIRDETEIDVRDLDADDLLYVLLQNYSALHFHEDREALRRGDRGFEAPFHPHRPDGQIRWAVSERAGLVRELERIRAR